MTIHKLALFWRAKETRCFTYIHFQATAAPRARAYEILEALAQLSELHLYGAVLDTMPLNVVYERPEPPTLITARLGLKLYPAAPLAPRHGITYLQFAIPQPIEELCRVSEAKATNFQGDGWQLLQRAVFPYLCLPNGTGAKLGTGHEVIKDVALIELDEEAQAQLRVSPFEPALTSTSADLEQTRQQVAQLQSRNEEPAQRDYRQIAKFQEQLTWLTTLQQLETDAFHALTAAPTAPLKAVAVSATALNLYDKVSDRKELSVKGKEIPHDAPQVTSETTNEAHQAAPAPTIYLPERPSLDDELWSDLPQGVFFDSTLWLHRTQLKEIYGIEERSYFRWINALRKFGLNRHLSAEQDAKVKLFYRPDVERAVVAYMAAKPHHRRSTASPGSQPASSPLFSSSASSDSNSPISRQLASQATSISTTTATAPAQASSVGGLFERDMRAAIASLAAQHQALAKAVAQLNHQLAQLATAISGQAAASSNTELMTRLVELLATITSNNASNQQLIALIEKMGGSSRSQFPVHAPAPVPTPAPIAAESPTTPAPATALRKPTGTKQSAKKKAVANKKAIAKNFLSVSQAAKLLNKDVATIRRWCDSGKLKAKKVGRQWQIDPNALKKKPIR